MKISPIVNDHDLKKEKLPTHGYLVFGLPVRGGHAIHLSKYKEEEQVFFANCVTNSDTMG